MTSAYGGRYVPDGSQLRGGMSAVVICTDPNLERKVAIKFLQQACDRRRIFDEVHALQRIRSKHVVQVFDIVIEQPGNQLGIVQEFLSGSDIVALSKTAPSRDPYMRLLYQLARGLEDIHEQGLIHRDIKPNNAKQDHEGIVKIFDFGLSRPDDDAQTRGFVGTIGFAAPELFSSGAVRFTTAVDVYALAATALFAVAGGTLPTEFLENPPRAESWTVTRGFQSLPQNLPGEVAQLLNAALATDPAGRPSVASIRQAIERHLVHGQHRALLVYNGQTHTCHLGQPTVTLSRTGAGTITIAYDGLVFSVFSVQGDVYINNAVVPAGSLIPTCCVITIGGPALKNQRAFITMDVSHPEVVL